MAAALALGGQGVWCGSVWLTTEESELEPMIRQKLLDATSFETVGTRANTGKSARHLRSGWTSAWEHPTIRRSFRWTSKSCWRGPS